MYKFTDVPFRVRPSDRPSMVTEYTGVDSTEALSVVPANRLPVLKKQTESVYGKEREKKKKKEEE